MEEIFEKKEIMLYGMLTRRSAVVLAIGIFECHFDYAIVELVFAIVFFFCISITIIKIQQNKNSNGRFL